MQHLDSPAKRTYRACCREWTDLPIFVQDWYLDSVCLGGSWEVVIYAEEEVVEAVMPYFIKKVGGLPYITMPLFVKFMGPFFKPGTHDLTRQHTLLNELIQRIPKVKCYKQDFHYSMTNWLPFYWQDYSETTRYSYQIELKGQSLETIYAGFSRNIHRNIKKAAKLLRLELTDDLETFYALNRESFDRHQTSIPYSFTFLQRHDRALATRGARQILALRDAQDRVHAMVYLIWDRSTCWYHFSGMSNELRSSGAGILMTWEAIKYAKLTLMKDFFDFEGSMIEGIEAIRRQFGGKQIPYFSLTKYHSTLVKWMDQVKQLASIRF